MINERDTGAGSTLITDFDDLVSPSSAVMLSISHPRGFEKVPLRDSLIVGRSSPSDVVVPDKRVSRQHVCFELRGSEVWLKDLGSSNGTIVDGRPLLAAREA